VNPLVLPPLSEINAGDLRRQVWPEADPGDLADPLEIKSPGSMFFSDQTGGKVAGGESPAGKGHPMTTIDVTARRLFIQGPASGLTSVQRSLARTSRTIAKDLG
jgi:hypothetical protein